MGSGASAVRGERYADWGREEFCPIVSMRGTTVPSPTAAQSGSERVNAAPRMVPLRCPFERPDPGIKLLSGKLFFEATQHEAQKPCMRLIWFGSGKTAQ